jgi:hypothetical protein
MVLAVAMDSSFVARGFVVRLMSQGADEGGY